MSTGTSSNLFTVGFAPGMNIFVDNCNRTEWSPIRSVIIRVINKIGRPRSGSPVCLVTRMVTDGIVRHEVLLPISHNYNKICDILDFFIANEQAESACEAASSMLREVLQQAEKFSIVL